MSEETPVEVRKAEPEPAQRLFQPPAPPAQTPSQPATRELTPEEKQFLNSLTELVTSAQELSYALAAIDTHQFHNDPEMRELLDAAKNVVRAVWRFHKLVKTRMRVE